MTVHNMGTAMLTWTDAKHIRGQGVRLHLLTSLPVLVSQPLVWSLGKHVSCAFPQKQVLLVWHVPCRLHGSAWSPPLMS